MVASRLRNLNAKSIAWRSATKAFTSSELRTSFAIQPVSLSSPPASKPSSLKIMCGICGIIHLDGQDVRAEAVKAMSETMAHRGPDGQGLWVKGSVGLGHRRLSIIDLSTGDQPMGTPDSSIQVVFNGEIYNFLQLKKVLETKGHVFRTTSDTESILYAYQEWGLDFVQHLRGMFAIALWDHSRKRLVLARDRLGKKPLYYCHDGRRLCFGSELKALLALPDLPRDMDHEALDAYLSFGYVPSPMSIFKQVRKLPPAHLAVCSDGEFTTWRYWDLNMEVHEDPGSEEGVVEELKSIFDEAVRLRLISDVPLGAFLSGGVDSSAVVASMALQCPQTSVKTTSIGFAEKDFDELPFSRVVAGQYHTDHSEYLVEPEALSILEDLVWHFDEPFADASAIPTYYVSKLARQDVTVALSGDGGDETFAGYVQRYRMNRFEDRIRRRVPGGIRRTAISGLARFYPRVESLPRPLRLKSFLTNISMSLEEAYFQDMSFYFTPMMKQRLYSTDLQREMERYSAFDVLGRHFAKNANDDVVSRVQYVDMMTYLPEDILVKVDRMSMANSLEVRAPILDHKLMEFAARIPSKYKLNGQESKYIFKKMNEGRLSRDILYRKKQGFCVPLASWFRGSIREYAQEILFDRGSKLNEWFQPQNVRRMWREHQSGRRDHSSQLWGLLMLEMWDRRFGSSHETGL